MSCSQSATKTGLPREVVKWLQSLDLTFYPKNVRSIRDVQGPVSDFTDREYQELLPTVARSTASRAIKNNLRITEIMAEPDISTNQRKAQMILHRHLEHKAAERVLNPGRFKLKPDPDRPAAKNLVSGDSALSVEWSGAAVSFKEIKVHQPVRRSLVNY